MCIPSTARHTARRAACRVEGAEEEEPAPAAGARSAGRDLDRSRLISAAIGNKRAYVSIVRRPFFRKGTP